MLSCVHMFISDLFCCVCVYRTLSNERQPFIGRVVKASVLISLCVSCVFVCLFLLFLCVSDPFRMNDTFDQPSCLGKHCVSSLLVFACLRFRTNLSTYMHTHARTGVNRRCAKQRRPRRRRPLLPAPNTHTNARLQSRTQTTYMHTHAHTGVNRRCEKQRRPRRWRRAPQTLLPVPIAS
jgi:hypothetical protein